MGALTSINLTKTIVDRAPKTGKRYHIHDAKLNGFGLRVEASGTKTYVVWYRTEDGGRNAPRRFMTVGRHGVLTVDEARAKGKAILGAVANGEDPADKRKARRKEMTISALIDLYEEIGCFIQRGKRIGEPMKPLTKKYTISRLRNHVVPLLGTKRITAVGATDIEKFSRDVAAGAAASDRRVAPRTRIKVRGGEGAARKLVRDLSAVFSFAIHEGLMTVSPVMRRG